MRAAGRLSRALLLLFFPSENPSSFSRCFLCVYGKLVLALFLPWYCLATRDLYEFKSFLIAFASAGTRGIHLRSCLCFLFERLAR